MSTASAVPTANTMAARFGHIPIRSIVESSTNPRKSFDKEKLQELAQSIKVDGIVQPIVVRLIKSDGETNRYEVIAGARRFRAAKLVGLTTVPASLVELNDEQAMRVQLIENAQREDISPLEEADAFQRLVASGMTPDELAKQIGKSKSHVYQCLQLLKLGKKARSLVDAGELATSVAIEIARLPENLQGNFAKQAAENKRSVRHVRDQVEKEMKAAAARAKVDAAIAKIRSKGEKGKILKISTSWDRDDDVLGPYRFKLVGKKLCKHTRLAVYAAGKNVGTAVYVCAENSCTVHNKEEATRSARYSAIDNRRRLEREAEKIADARAIEAVVNKVKAFDATVQRALVVALANSLYWERAKYLCERLELTKPQGRKVSSARDHNAILAKHALSLGGKELARLGLETAMLNYGDAGEVIASCYKVNVAALRRQALRALKAKSKKAKKVQTSARKKKVKAKAKK